MTINDLFAELHPEEQELSSEAKERILNRVMKSERKNRSLRSVRMGMIAAVLVVVLCISAVAIYKIDWNQRYRERFNVKSEDVQGFVEYPDAEVTEEATLHSVSCVSGIKGLEFRFSYGPISKEEVDALDLFSGKQSHILRVDIKEMDDVGCDAQIEEYDEINQVALVKARIYGESMPDEITAVISKMSMATGETAETIGELVIIPEKTKPVIAELNLPLDGPDGSTGMLLAFRIDSGSYCWVYDIPGIEAWNGDIAAIVSDQEYDSKYVFELTNSAFEAYERDSYITFRDGSTLTMGGGLGPMWDGEHLCDWGGSGVYDIENLISITINGIEYPFSPVDSD